MQKILTTAMAAFTMLAVATSCSQISKLTEGTTPTETFQSSTQEIKAAIDGICEKYNLDKSKMEIYEFSVGSHFTVTGDLTNSVDFTMIDPDNHDKMSEFRYYVHSNGTLEPYAKEEVVMTDRSNNVIEGYDNFKDAVFGYDVIESYLAGYDTFSKEALDAAKVKFGSQTPYISTFKIEDNGEDAGISVGCKEVITLSAYYDISADKQHIVKE